MNRQIRSDTLKKLAMLFMLIDHIGAIVIERLYIVTIDFDKAQRLYDINEILRAFGRIAMPIFCYQTVVGLFKTRNKLRHLALLFFAAIISEIPFDLGSEGIMFDKNYQNVIFTLLLGTVAILLIEWFDKSQIYADITSEKLKKVAYALFSTACVFATSAIAELIKSDYGAKGVILVWIFYFFRSDKIKMSTYGIILFLIDIALITYLRTTSIKATFDYCEFEAYACLAFPLIFFDNGERKGGALLKWFGYAFYPAHMLILYFISLYVMQIVS